jgi:hypothetical protein
MVGHLTCLSSWGGWQTKKADPKDGSTGRAMRVEILELVLAGKVGARSTEREMNVSAQSALRLAHTVPTN